MEYFLAETFLVEQIAPRFRRLRRSGLPSSQRDVTAFQNGEVVHLSELWTVHAGSSSTSLMDSFAVKHAGDVSHTLTVTHHLDCSPAVLEIFREVRKIVLIAAVGWATVAGIRIINGQLRRRD